MDTLTDYGGGGIRCISEYRDYCRFGVNGAELWVVADEGLAKRHVSDARPRCGPWALR